MFPSTNTTMEAACAARRTSDAVRVLLLEHAAVRVVGRAHVRAHHVAQLVSAHSPAYSSVMLGAMSWGTSYVLP